MRIDRRYEAEYRVRFDEADADGWLRPSGLLRYAQDIAWRHSEDAGFDRAFYDERGMHWLVRNVTLTIEERPTYGERLAISTEVVGWRHVWARRRCLVRRRGADADASAGAELARIDTDWVLLRDDGRPTQAPDEIARHFVRGLTFTRNKVLLPEAPVDASTTRVVVRPADIDPLGHLNNAAYLDLVDEAIARAGEPGAAARPEHYRVGYVLPALPGEEIDVSCWSAAGGEMACRISRDDGTELTRVLVSSGAR